MDGHRITELQRNRLIERGNVPGPSLQVPGHRLFSEEDVDRIREALKDESDTPKLGTKWTAAAYREQPSVE
jgi:hypothetical protein